ncbi:hypothetical protein QJS10_CPA06g00747 [Acorus calamus]|uniref:2Fe-2S ferredoxin-type domain-containing protein n=1 Tax=Acorus calamus TaxID=4465 RepID=A0AAV9ELD7_ACOCL|nr:hypothetical protein QJS10_CPA06g00737 [Acorus calamus]KAK1314576.1 hypothetical protein QJS10_CPA06g00747 [Acorus calamus]
MGVLQFNTSLSLTFNTNTRPTRSLPNRLNLTKTRVLRSAEPVQETGVLEEAVMPEEPPSIDFAFVSARPLLNCGGGGTCGTCLVEVVEGKELLSLRTDKEKEALKKRPKTWRLACQTMVGRDDSRGQVVIQTLPDWKVHEWEN